MASELNAMNVYHSYLCYRHVAFCHCRVLQVRKQSMAYREVEEEEDEAVTCCVAHRVLRGVSRFGLRFFDMM